MPSRDSYKNRFSINSTVGKSLKSQSDKVMESTWYHDPNTKTCYLCDYFHDGNKYNLTVNSDDLVTDNLYEVDLKVILSEYNSLSKDDASAFIQFKPSHNMSGECLDYFKSDYHDMFGVPFPIGLYVYIMNDETKLYEKWLICARDVGDVFVKYFILKCDYIYQWVEEINSSKRITRQMCGVSRSQNSYNSGLWRDCVIHIVRYI